jgi:outer membrane biosynthesis protein TonB
MHALKNLELAHYVDRLQDENDELRKLMGWLTGHEPQLWIMIETFKRQDGEGLGANKVGEGSGEHIPEPPKTHHKNDFPPKPNHLRNRLDTTPAPPVSPPQTNDFQKPIKFVSTSEKVLSKKESEKASEVKPVEKSSGEKPSEQPQPKPKPKLVRFHRGYCGRDGHKDEFCFKRKQEERMAKEWANKDKYHPSDVVLEPRVQMPRAKASVRTIPAWGERKVVGGAAGRATPVRSVRGTGQTGAGLTGSSSGFVLVQV